jgi:putative ABC transport system permease protein
MSDRPRPPLPKWVGWSLSRLLPPDEYRVVLNELAELHAAWSATLGAREARRRYLRQLRRYPFVVLAHKVRTRGRPPIPGLREGAQAARSLLRSPGLATTILLTVGIGIGGCTLVFAVVDALYLRALPYPDGDRIQLLFSEEGTSRWPLSVVDVEALRSQATDFAGVAAYGRATPSFENGDVAERLEALVISPGFFDVLGVRLLSGRGPTEEDAAPGAPRTMLVPLGFARDRLGSSRPDGSDVLGRDVRVDGADTRIVGVLPTDFGPLARNTQIFKTLQLDPPTRRGPFFLWAVGRLRDGVAPGAAREQLRQIARRIYPLWDSSYQDEQSGLGMETLATHLRGDSARLVEILMGAGALVLIIAVANVAGLLLARVSSRGTELAVRAAMGASRARVAGHLLTESALLAGGGALVGLLAARGGIALLPSVASGYIPRLDELTLSGRVLAFALVLAAGSSLVFALVPALRWRADVGMADHLRGGGRGATSGRDSRRTQRLLVAGQLAVSMPLLAAAGLLVSTFAHLEAIDPGFATEHVVTMRVSLTSARYARDDDRAVFWNEALPRLAAVPGVASVGLSEGRPPDDHPMDNAFDLEDRPVGPGSGRPIVPWIAADSGFFETLRVPLLAGRLFDSHDAAAAEPVVVVDEAWTRRFFPGENAVGRRLHPGGATGGPWTTVIGVVGDVPFSGLGDSRHGVVYDPRLSYSFEPFLYVRTSGGDPTGVVGALRDELRRIDPSIPVTAIATADEVLQASLSHPRSFALVVALFSAVALGLAVLGLYGVTAYGVQQRRGEIAVRLTLGGTPRAVLGLVARDGMALAAGGLAVGLPASLLATRVLSTILYGVGPRDPLTLAAASLVLLTVSAAACFVPGLRAVRVDPASTLREE